LRYKKEKDVTNGISGVFKAYNSEQLHKIIVLYKASSTFYKINAFMTNDITVSGIENKIGK